MIGLIEAVHDFIGQITNPSDYRFHSELHKFVQQVAYAAARTDRHKETQETYWNAAKAHIALELTTNKNVPLYRNLSSGFFSPPKEELPLCQDDAEVIGLGLKFEGCKYGYHTSPYLPNEARSAINQYIQILRNNWYSKSKSKRKKPVEIPAQLLSAIR